MRWQRRVSVIDAHAEGEVGRVILAGVPEPPGATLFEKKRYLENRDDSLRRDLEIEVPEIGGIPAVVPRLTGRGWIFATHEFGCNPDDPFPEGFTLPDTWGPGISSGSTES